MNRVPLARRTQIINCLVEGNMGQIQSYRINHVISLVEREVAAERARCVQLVDLHVSDREDAHSLKQAIQNG